jgi:hypothetical protein
LPFSIATPATRAGRWPCELVRASCRGGAGRGARGRGSARRPSVASARGLVSRRPSRAGERAMRAVTMKHSMVTWRTSRMPQTEHPRNFLSMTTSVASGVRHCRREP